MDDEEKKNVRKIGIFVTIPFVLAVPPIVGWFIGTVLDKLAGTAPYLMYLFVLLGLVAGFREMLRIVRRYGNED